MELQNLAAIATILTLLVTLGSLAFSAKRYLDIRERELEKERFSTYHALLKTISKGQDAEGTLKLVSQIAYINELTKFPEYSATTEQSLNLLRTEWADKVPDEIKKPLLGVVDETLATIQSNR